MTSLKSVHIILHYCSIQTQSLFNVVYAVTLRLLLFHTAYHLLPPMRESLRDISFTLVPLHIKPALTA